MVGRLLKIGPLTKDAETVVGARICVEVDASKPLQKLSVWLGMGASGRWQDLVPLNPPTFCSKCCKLGHDSERGKIVVVLSTLPRSWTHHQRLNRSSPS